jgi:hypothetical protein
MKHNPQSIKRLTRDEAHSAVSKLLSVMMPEKIVDFNFTITPQPGNSYVGHATIVVPNGTIENSSMTIVNRLKSDTINEITTKIRQYLGMNVLFSKVQIVEESKIETTE